MESGRSELCTLLTQMMHPGIKALYSLNIRINSISLFWSKNQFQILYQLSCETPRREVLLL